MNLKKKIISNPFKWLFIIFFVLYIITACSVSLFEFNYRLKYISKLVLNTINQESDKFQYFLTELYKGKYVASDIESNLHALTSKNFSEIKIFDKKYRLLFYAKSKEIKNFEGISKKFFKNFILERKQQNFGFFYYKQRLYLILMKQIASKGYIQAIYRVPKNMDERIKANLIQSIKIISVIILITFFITFMLTTSLTNTIKEFNLNLLKENINSLKTIGHMIAKRDSETGEHNYRVTYYAVKIAEELSKDKDINMNALIKGAFLHDIGKIAIPDKILLKPGKLSDTEFEIMKTHVLHGYEIIKNNDFLADAVDVVLYHHEKIDGTGYMKGLKGEEIPLNARIFAVADVFDALTSKRPYKDAFSFEKSLNIIKEDTGKHFCPFVVKAFEKIAFEIYKNIKEANLKQLEEFIEEIVLKYFN